MMLSSIRARLTATFSLCLGLAMIAAVCCLIWYISHSAERNADAALAAVAGKVAVETEDARDCYDRDDLIEELAEDLHGSNLALSITDRRGHLVAKSQRNAPLLSSVHDFNWRVRVVRLDNGDTVVIGQRWDKTRSILRSYAIALIFLGAFVALIASAGAWLLVGRALRPISLLARQARASSTDNLAVNLELPSQDHEMVELVDTLNGLLRRVTETAAGKGRFYSAASHELRTPLQALSGHLELALSRDRSKEEYKAATGEAYAQTKRLVSLVRALLMLYQLDAPSALPLKEQVDLVSTCKGSLSQLRPLIEERGLTINLQAPAELMMAAPSGHVDIVLRNLIENAIKYSSKHGCIDVGIAAEEDWITIGISNDTAEPLGWTSSELFEPFSRPDSSRNSRTGGTGLGLAICKAIADANNWRLDIQRNDHRVYTVLSARSS